MGWLYTKPDDEPGAAWPSIAIGMFVAFGGILYGYDTGTISGIQEMPYWIREFNEPDDTDLSLIVSILSAGTFFGALSAGIIADILGRRWGIIFSVAIVFNLGVALQTAATTQPLFVAGRFFAGLGVGLVSAQVPMYQSEVLPKWIRGAVVGSYQLAITVGLFLAAIVNFGTKDRNDSGSYRIPIALQFAWSLILMTGMFFLPETPRFLVKQNRHDQALKSLTRLRRLPADHPGLQAELAEVEANYQYEISVGTAGYLECFKGTIGKRLMTGCFLQALQQLSGVNFIFYYGTTYFTNAGFDSDPFIIQVITNVVNVFSTFPGLWAVDNLGRRNLLLIGAAGMFVSQFIVAITGTAASQDNSAAQNAAIAFICIFIFFFASSWGPVAWVVTGEMFPLKVRAKCLSMTTATNWLFNWALAFATPYMVGTGPNSAQLGSKVFFIWGSFCALCFVFVYLLIYETKNLSLEQVNELYEVVGKAWQSKKFRPQVNFAEAKRDGSTDRHMSLSDMHAYQQRKNSQVEDISDSPNGSNEKV